MTEQNERLTLAERDRAANIADIRREVSAEMVDAGVSAFASASPSLFEYSVPLGFGEALAEAYAAMAAVAKDQVNAIPRSRKPRGASDRLEA